MTRLSPLLCIALLLSKCTWSSPQNPPSLHVSSQQNSVVPVNPENDQNSHPQFISDNTTLGHSELNYFLENTANPLNRTKRQSLAGLAGLNLGLIPNGQGNANSVESLLASCQLTNLLMYQLLQQKQQQSPLNPAIQPLPINQNLLIPQAETLTTYITTSTYVTDMTTTALVTIPLLFGNKPVSTTITRTKTYQVTSSEVKTLTSTIRPTYAQLSSAALMSTEQPDPTLASDVPLQPSVGDLELSKSKTIRILQAEESVPDVNPKRQFSTEAPEDLDKVTKIARNQRGKGRKGRPVGKVATDNIHANLAAKKIQSRVDSAQYKILRDNRDRSRANPQKVSNPFSSDAQDRVNRYVAPQNRPTGPGSRSRGSIREVSTTRQRIIEPQPDPDYAQYPDDYSYYARRLKRGQQRQGHDSDFDEYPLEREYLLEPSFQETFPQTYGPDDKCPPVEAIPKTVTLTETHTVTKFVNPTVCPSSCLRGSSNTQTGGFSHQGRSRSRFRSPTSTEKTPTRNGNVRSRQRTPIQQDQARF